LDNNRHGNTGKNKKGWRGGGYGHGWGIKGGDYGYLDDPNNQIPFMRHIFLIIHKSLMIHKPLIIHKS